MQPVSAFSARALITCFAVVVSLTCVTRVNAATLANYRSRVARMIALTKQLQGAYDDTDTSQREYLVTANAARIREELPPKETVTIDSQSVNVDNTWLDSALRGYENTSTTKTQRLAVLARIEERLRALDERLEEVQRANSAASDKDGDKGRLAEILRRSDYSKPTPAKSSAISRLLDRFLRWISNLIPTPKPIAPGGSPFISGLAQIVVVVVCLVGIAFLIWKLAPRYLKNRGKKKEKREARIVLGERLEPDQSSADLLAQAETLARNGDLRAAIRKAYIALLCELGDRKIVSLAQHKTNRDYLNSVRERTRLYSSMRQLTSSFELHWYGFQPVVENDWIEFRSGYQKALRSVL